MPSAQAPSPTASSASGRQVRPQTLTRGVVIGAPTLAAIPPLPPEGRPPGGPPPHASARRIRVFDGVRPFAEGDLDGLVFVGAIALGTQQFDGHGFAGLLGGDDGAEFFGAAGGLAV